MSQEPFEIEAHANEVEKESSPPPHGGQEFTGSERPEIIYREADLPAIVEMVESGLVEWNKVDGGTLILQHAGEAVRIVPGGQARPRRGVKVTPKAPMKFALNIPYLRNYLTKQINFKTQDRRKSGEGLKEIACPKLVAETFLSQIGEYRRLPVLNGILTHPTLNLKGELLDRPGFDEKSGLLLDFGGRGFPSVPAFPDRAEALLALKTIQELFGEFPFKTPADASAVLALFLTVLVRWLLDTCPGFAVSANARGTGKTLLTEIISLATQGHEPIITGFTSDQKEMAQRIFSILKMAGGGIVLLDNVEQSLGGEALNMAITSPELTNRVLGQSEMQTVPTAVTFVATGNNLVISGDATSRFLRINLDAQMEHPENRRFKRDIKAYALEQGPAVVAAGLTVLRAYILASDKPEVEPWRFGEWNRLIRGAILWLGLPDPLSGLRETEAQDPEREALGAVLQAWRERFKDRPTLVKDALEPLKDVWELAISSRSGVNVKTAGRLLARQVERRVDGLRFVRAGKEHQAVLWKVLKDEERDHQRGLWG